jgi:hypothetical protein
VSFLFPAVLGGLAAISIPIAIHLLNKFRVRVVDWAAMRFLLDSLRKNERRVKLEDLLLLILRCLFVAFLVLAFARPVLKALAAGGTDDGGPVSAVVLLDNSASMTQSNAVENRFEQAKKEIQKWVDARDAQSLAAFYLVSNRAQAVLPRPTADLPLFRKMLETAKPTDRGTDLLPGLRLAFQTLAETGGSQREIRVYSDDQKAGWMGLEEVRKLVDENPGIALRPIAIGTSGENNVGIISLRPTGGVPSAGQPSRMRAEVGNYGTQPTEELKVSLAIDGLPSGEAQLPPIAPGATQAVEVVLNFPESGPHVVTARIPPDALAIDNERATAVNVVRRMNVLIVESSQPETPMDRDGYFLANALVPLPPEKAAQYYLGASFTTASQLDAASLADASAVFFANAVDISPDTARLLRNYVAEGGNLVIFPGSQADPSRWKQVSDWASLLPALLGPPRVAEEGKPFAWQSRDFEHPVTALWNDPAQGSLGSVKALQYFPLVSQVAAAPAKDGEPVGQKPSVIARLEDGEPAAVEWTFGKGHVVLFNSSATPEANNLPLHPAFVGLMQRLMGYLMSSDQGRLVLSPGEPFVMPVPADWRGKDFSVQPPGENADAQVAGQVGFDEGKASIRFANTDAVGAYRVFVDKEPVAAFAVQLDPRESDLRQVEHSTLESLTKPTESQPGKVAERRMVVTKEFWTPLIWIALAFAIVECALAHRFSYAR